jgi:long-subunit acyl-CoA synthetase (AMP-forming)
MPVAFRLPLQVFFEREARHPRKPFLVQPVGGDEVQTLTWAEVGHQARCAAHWLRARELPQGSHIALISKNCAHWIIADLAIWMAGHVSVPLYPNLTADSVAHVLKHSEAALVFIGKLDDWPAMAPGVPADVPTIGLPLCPAGDLDFSWAELQACSPIQDQPLPAASDLATIIYTSGTTGLPKGVMHSFGALGFAATGGTELFGLGEGDRLLSYLPLCHVAERMFVELAAIYTGQTVYFAESLETFLRDLRRARPTALFGGAAYLDQIPDGRLWQDPGDAPGAPVAAALYRQTRGPQGAGRPGPGRVTYCAVRRGAGARSLAALVSAPGPGCAGGVRHDRELRLFPCVSPRPADDRLDRPCHARALKCVSTRSAKCRCAVGATMLGYFKDPEKTAETLTPDGFLRTGDKGEQDAEGRLRLTGRLKEIFKTSKGKYVAPAPIENRLAEHARIEQVCVVGDGLPAPMGLCVLSAAGPADARQALHGSLERWLEQVNAALDKHERLRQLVVVKDSWAVENGFLTPTLKIRRNVIESTYGPQFQVWSERTEVILWQD